MTLPGIWSHEQRQAGGLTAKGLCQRAAGQAERGWKWAGEDLKREKGGKHKVGFPTLGNTDCLYRSTHSHLAEMRGQSPALESTQGDWRRKSRRVWVPAPSLRPQSSEELPQGAEALIQVQAPTECYGKDSSKSRQVMGRRSEEIK